VDVVTVLAEHQLQLNALTAAVAALTDAVTGKLQGRAVREQLRHLAMLQDHELSLLVDRCGRTDDLPEDLDLAHGEDLAYDQDPIDADRDRTKPARGWTSRRGDG
jgi:hypothetical protein